MPERIQRKRSKGWKMPEGAVYVGRGSCWGNPWRIGQVSEPVERTGPTFDRVAETGSGAIMTFDPPIKLRQFVRPLTATDVVTRYRTFIIETVGLDRIRRELHGKDLACWCPPGQPCHADVLLEMANAPQPGGTNA